MAFQTEEGLVVPAVTAEQMREVDRIAVDEFGLGILQMMENAGRNLAQNVMDMLDGRIDGVVDEGGPCTAGVERSCFLGLLECVDDETECFHFGQSGHHCWSLLGVIAFL